MRRLLFRVVGACAAVGLFGLVPLAGTSAALPSLSPLTAGEVTFSAQYPSSFSFYGTINQNGLAFTGLAGGSAPADPPFVFGNNRITPFAFSGNGLDGICSGQWLVGPYQSLPNGLDGLGVRPNLVIAGTLECSLNGFDGIGLSFAMVQVLPGQYQGAFGPGPKSLVPLPTVGAADMVADNSNSVYSLVGRLTFGGASFEGEAESTLVGGPLAPFQLTGSTPGGNNVTATCDNTSELALDSILRNFALPAYPPATPVVSLLTCTGSVNGAPPATAQILMVLPVRQAYYPPCTVCAATEATGVYLGV